MKLEHLARNLPRSGRLPTNGYIKLSVKEKELLEVRPLKEWEGESLPEGFKVFAKACDEQDQVVVEIWRFREIYKLTERGS